MKRSVYWLMAAAAGIVVANNYYNQPLLADFALTFHTTERAAGAASVATQTGYALGLLLFVPLGDMLDRRSILGTLLCISSLALAAVAVSPTLDWLVAASFLTGLTSVAPQLLTPFAAQIAGPERRGEAVGIVMFGLLSGILMSRAVSGSIAQHCGWRTVYWLASAAMLVTAAVLSHRLPRSTPTWSGTYRRLMGSLWTLIREEALLRRTSAIAALQFAAFSAFWVTLTFHLRSMNAHYGSEIAGLFGLVGVVGALASTGAGKLIDKRNPRLVVLASSAIFFMAFAIFAWVGYGIAGLIAGVILLDFGLQSAHVANMARSMSIRSDAMSRINTLYMTIRFAGGALGSLLGVWAWSVWQWPGVCGVGLILACGSLALQAGPGVAGAGVQERCLRD
ncbi:MULTISPECIES: MFS transporter [Caballeronia]|uniref:MFS transporter n=1 Tax=Caballeronia TaxID=1827195 RepID=UPI00158EB04C|nr:MULTISPECIES: MFS transporter [Caballeronia]MCG7404026.1 MFS transporter [Caballeronia zhejiangensis]MCI1045405.1 MFS transporter [Caballeronia zhejiangensis]